MDSTWYYHGGASDSSPVYKDLVFTDVDSKLGVKSFLLHLRQFYHEWKGQYG